VIRLRTILTGQNLPKIQQPPAAPTSTINEKTVADFTRVVEQTGILKSGVATDLPHSDGPTCKA
jgi:hypothetical protein